MSFTSWPLTKPSMSVSVFRKISSYRTFSDTGTTQFTDGCKIKFYFSKEDKQIHE